uniref:CARD domain-containing protein n=1 Tax=Pygocentrus nattereri TaxID=42514 RepID=A0A3B4DAX3_PYGNA
MTLTHSLSLSLSLCLSLSLSLYIPKKQMFLHLVLFKSSIHFVDFHRKSLIQKVKLVEPIADDLYPKISEEKYSRIKEAKTSQDKMRVIYDDILLSGGQMLKEVFLQSLRQNEPDLIAELSRS